MKPYTHLKQPLLNNKKGDQVFLASCLSVLPKTLQLRLSSFTAQQAAGK